MKQLDIETSNYKFKDEVKMFVNSFNEVTDKYLKSFENSDADLKKVTANIEKKTAAIEKLEASLVDFGNRTDELRALKELSSEDIKSLEAKKSQISYTDSEVQKMETDDIIAQINAKKGKISKIEAKLESTKAKVKSSNEEKRTQEKQLKELEKQRRNEEEALFKTDAILTLIKDTKTNLNDKILEIVNAPYKPVVETEVVEAEDKPSVSNVSKDKDKDKSKKKPKVETDERANLDAKDVNDFGITEEDLSIFDFNGSLDLDAKMDFPALDIGGKETSQTEVKKEEKKKGDSELSSAIDKAFRKESIDISGFSKRAIEKMNSKEENVLANLEILKKHNVPLEYTVKQSEIYYDITSQDLDDLLSIITTDDDGNGMGFTIDFTYNILSELSKINVDKLIDVYNEEFMNINSKSGIIQLLKLTNPNLTHFDNNRNANVEVLKSIGTMTVDNIVKKYPEFVDMDSPLFMQVLNVFDRSDLVDKLNSDIDVIPKIMDYWKNN